MNRALHLSCLLSVAVLAAACVSGAPPAPTQPPATPKFVFNPPGQATKKLDRAVAIVGPKTSGNLWAIESITNRMAATDERNRSRQAMTEMLKAARVDLEKVVIARGFNSVGPFASLDEMTYSQKERSFVLFEPVSDTTVQFADQRAVPNLPLGGSQTKGTVTARGSVTLAFYEPLSKEKVWLKRVDLPEVSEPYVVDQAIGADGRLLRYRSDQADALIRSLNKFYASAMDTVWAQVDAREVVALQRDVDQLKAKKRY